MALPGIEALTTLQAEENPYRGADCIQLSTFDGGGSGTIVGNGASAGSGTGVEVSISGGLQKLGTDAYRIGGTNGYYRWNGQSVYSFASGTDFTLDFWHRPLFAGAAGTTRYIYSHASSGSFYIAQFGDTGTLRFNLNGTNYDAPGLTLNVWHHIAITRQGTTVYMFLDGALVATKTGDTVSYNVNSGYPRFGQGRGTGVHGDFDEWHIQKGTGRWTEAFTPLEVPYTDTP